MRGHSRPKDGVATLAYDPRIHEATQRLKSYGCHPLRFIMDCRVKPGNDAARMVRDAWTTFAATAQNKTARLGGPFASDHSRAR
jgi:hypothetical protein